MKLTNEQRNAVKHNGHAFITACPGSGKTRTLIAKLLRCIDEVRDTSQRIACITYTNAGVYEIDQRLRLYGKSGDDHYCDISTIHSFCLNNILTYFYWRVKEYSEGFSILPSDSDKYREIVASVCTDYNLDKRCLDLFELLNREPDGTPIAPYPLTTEIALDFWERLQNGQFIDFPNIIYFSYRLLLEQTSISQALACRFCWILVDEFQDTSALQVEILRLIAARNKTKFFLVGDPHQSIFGFAGARPNLMEEFVHEINAESNFSLLTNFRSSEPIVVHAERLFSRTPPMISDSNNPQSSTQPTYINSESLFLGIIEYFIPALDELGIDLGRTAILAPWWVKLLHLGRQLRDYGIPIIGPGARPYKRNHLFALLAEQICAYIEHPHPSLIPQIERELFMLLNNVNNSLNFKVYTYNGRTTVYRLIRKGIELRKNNEAGIVWLRKSAVDFSNILISDEFLVDKESVFLIDSVEDMIKDMEKNMADIDIANLSVTDLGLFASTKNNLQLRTIHRSKGLEFDAVAIVDLHEGRIPNYRAETPDQIEESKRLLYVAITRSRRLLMYFTDNENPKNRPSRFLLSDGLALITE